MDTRSRITLALAGIGLTGSLTLAGGAALLTLSCTLSGQDEPTFAPIPTQLDAPAGEAGEGEEAYRRLADTGAAHPAPKTEAEPAADPGFTDDQDPDVPRTDVPREPQAFYDFGGSTWLSNDDSMSLASAQRMLWALQRGHRVAPSQIRKHELLNYFTFRSTEPRRGQVFGVSASAEHHDQQLDLALVVQGIEPDPQPLDLTLLVDRSGSMDTDGRMGFTKRGLRLLLEQLRPGDTVDLIAFDGDAEVLVEDFVIGDQPTSALRQRIDAITPTGSTDLSRGLQVAYEVARGDDPDPHRNRRVLLVTDANTNRGVQDQHLLSEVGRHLDEAGVRLSGVGVGRDFDDDLLDRLTEKGKGAYVFLGSEVVVDRVFGTGFPALVHTIAHDVRFQLHLPESLAMKRFHGEEASTDKVDIQPVHFFAGNTQAFFSELAVADDGLQPADALRLDITWRDPATGEPRTQHHTVGVDDALEASPHNVRKARALTAFSDLVLADALHTDCTSELVAFRTATEPLPTDPEITFLGPLAPTRCAGDARVSTRTR